MAIGTRRHRGDDDYIFVDGKAMRADEAVRIQVDTPTEVPGQSEEASVPGADEAAPDVQGATGRRSRHRRGRVRESFDKMERDGLELRDDFLENGLAPGQAASLRADDRRKMRIKYLISGGILLLLLLFSFCISEGYNGLIYNPLDVLMTYITRIQIFFSGLFRLGNPELMMMEAYKDYPMLYDAPTTFLSVMKYAICGAFLAVAGMLYQNAFRNPIAAPSMLGISNGTSIALLILVLVFGSEAAHMTGAYYLFSFVGGAGVLVLVIMGGNYISGRGTFNVVNMLLMGTIISQLLGVITRYVQTNFLSEDDWLTYYTLQAAADVDSVWTYVSMILGVVIAFVPIFLFRFRLNLISFSDEETTLLGVNPNRLRILALGCGSLLLLVAQVNAGQSAMVSLVIPFVVRAVYGAEFRKQLIGNLICGAMIMVLCWDVTSFFYLTPYGLNVGSIISIVALPLFIWMIAIQQRSWE